MALGHLRSACKRLSLLPGSAGLRNPSKEKVTSQILRHWLRGNCQPTKKMGQLVISPPAVPAGGSCPSGGSEAPPHQPGTAPTLMSFGLGDISAVSLARTTLPAPRAWAGSSPGLGSSSKFALRIGVLCRPLSVQAEGWGAAEVAGTAPRAALFPRLFLPDPANCHAPAFSPAATFLCTAGGHLVSA